MKVIWGFLAVLIAIAMVLFFAPGVVEMLFL